MSDKKSNAHSLVMKRTISDTSNVSDNVKKTKQKKMPYRVKYVPDSATHISRGDKDSCEYFEEDDLDFQIVDWYSSDVVTEVFEEDDEEEYHKSQIENREYMIRLFGVTAGGHSIATTVTGFNPYFYIKVPQKWNKIKCEEFIKENVTHKKGSSRRYDPITREMYMAVDYKDRNFRVDNKEDGTVVWCSFDSALLGWEQVMMHDLNAGFTGIPAKKFKFLKLTFKTHGSLQSCYWNLRKQKQHLRIDIYEANLDPQLRFMHIKDILAAGWVRLPGMKYKIIKDVVGDGSVGREISTQIETTISWLDIEALARQDVAPLRQASFDIECYSHEHDKMPVPEDNRNPVIQIGTVIQDYGDPEKYIKHIITLKKCNPIKDTIVICCETEYELLVQWSKFIRETDPDILYGYNIFGFDLNYLMVRAEKLGCTEFTYLGRMKYIQSELETKDMSSAAYGDNRFKMVPMPGRLQIDLLQVMLRDVTKYRSYTLGYISQQILSSKLCDDPIHTTQGSTRVFIKHKNHLYTEGTVIHLFNMFKCGGYDYDEINKMHIITEVVYDGDGDKRIPLGYYIEMWTAAKVTEQGGGDDDPRSFETKFDLPAPQIFKKYASGTPEEITEIAEYCVQDCMLPQKIINKCNILINTLEMAKATYVPTSYLITRGQQIKVFSQITKCTREHDYLVPTIESKKVDLKKKKGKDKYKGATVLDPLKGSYWDGVACLDFKALYPTTEIDWNLCYTTLVKDEKYMNLPGVEYFTISVGMNTYVFAQSEMGIIPKILVNLLNARDRAKEEMYSAKTAFMKDVFNGKQLAFKISCNSVYGFTGCGDTGMLPCKPIAEATTTIGRGMIEKSKEFSENPKNFDEVIGCVDFFPMTYTYLCELPSKKHSIMTTDKLLKWYKINVDDLHESESIELWKEDMDDNPLKVWTTDEFQQITSFECKQQEFKGEMRWLYWIRTSSGSILDFNKYQCTTIYGDSVTGETPVLIKGYETGYKRVDKLVSDWAWEKFDMFKYSDEGRWAKEYANCEKWPTPMYVWTASSVKNHDGITYKGKWTKVNKVIRHKTNKDIYRVTSGRGYIDVTEDHSLISYNMEAVSPKYIRKNMENGFRLCMASLEDTNISLKDAPMDIDYTNIWESHSNDQIQQAKLYHQMSMSGLNPHIINSRQDVYVPCALGTRDGCGKRVDDYKGLEEGVISIEKIGSSNGEYVYDLETEEGTFCAGVGEIVASNTDSVFTNFDTTDQPTNVHKIAYSMIIGAYVANRITDFLRSLNPYKPYGEQWTELEYEKVYLELLLLTKKRYVGSLYELNPYKKSYIDKKGVALKRRDYCKYVHDVFKGVLKCFFDDREPDIQVRIERAKNVVIQGVDDLLKNQIPFEKLILSKLLKGRYKIRDQTKAKSFNEKNIFVDDMIKWNNDEYGVCTGVVRRKHVFKMKNFFDQSKSSEGSKKPLEVILKETEEGKMPSSCDNYFSLDYDDIKAKIGHEITLEKIMDPKTKESELEKVKQPHARLARKMFARDPGSAPSSGVRLQFMFVESKSLSAQQHERSEHPDYVKKHNLRPDAIYYIEHQLKTPMLQLFALVMPDPESLFREAMNNYRNRLIGQTSIKSFFGKK